MRKVLHGKVKRIAQKRLPKIEQPSKNIKKFELLFHSLDDVFPSIGNNRHKINTRL